MGGDEKQAKPKKANTIRVCQRKKFQKKKTVSTELNNENKRRQCVNMYGICK
jgi:hypothetical protein